MHNAHNKTDHAEGGVVGDDDEDNDSHNDDDDNNDNDNDGGCGGRDGHCQMRKGRGLS